MEGDLLQQFEDDLEAGDKGKAIRRFVWNVVCFFRPGILLRNTLPYKIMNPSLVISDFRIATRSLVRDSMHSTICAGGLTLSLTVFLFILSIILDEVSYDMGFEDAGRVYRISMIHQGESPFNSAWTPPTIGKAFKQNYPEIEAFATLHKYWKGFSVTNGTTEIPVEAVYVANPGCFSVFSFHFLEGDPASALASLESMVVSASLARKVFGQPSVLGKTIVTTFGKKTITGVIEDIEFNSHLEPPEVLLSTVGFHGQSDFLDNWRNDASTYNYVKLGDGVSFDAVKDKLDGAGVRFANRWIRESRHESENQQFATGETILEFQSLTDIHLHSHKEFEIKPNGSAQYVYVLASVGFLLILVSSINYMNLATAKVAARAKEVGVRKTMGSHRFQLIRQFLTESWVLAFIAIFVSIILFAASFPVFSTLYGKPLDGSLLLSPRPLFLIPCIPILIGMLGGLYPSMVLSRFTPANALKGNVTVSGGRFPLRQLLVVGQFAVALILVSSTFIVYLQLDYASHAELGFDKDKMLAVEIRSVGDRPRIKALKNSFSTVAGVRDVALTAQIPGGDNIKTEPFLVESAEGGFREQLLQYAFVDPDFVSTLRLKLTKGRDFDPSETTYGSSVIVNEKLVKRMEWKSPLGMKIRLPIGVEAEVIGVVADFHIRSLHDPIQPIILINLPDWANFVLVKIDAPNIRPVLSELTNRYSEIMGETPFTYSFIDTCFQLQYASDERRGKVFLLFSGIVVAVAFIGLLGIMRIAISQRTREIGIRKVMGASMLSLSVLLSRKYVILVLLASIVGFPFAWWAADEWLGGFSYRITLQWWMFVFPMIAVLTMAFSALAVQSLRTLFLNPIDSLRSE